MNHLYQTYCTDIPAPTIYQLTEELVEIDQWYFLGVVLKVPVSKLKEIQGSSPQAGISFWRIEVLYHWLQSTPHASWNDIVLALKKISQHALSARLQEKYITPYTAGTGMSCSTNAIVWMYSMSYCNTDCIVLFSCFF